MGKRYGRSPRIGMHMIANANASTGMISRGFTISHFRKIQRREPRSGNGNGTGN
jgi:hypothetical protein